MRIYQKAYFKNKLSEKQKIKVTGFEFESGSALICWFGDAFIRNH